MIGLDSLIQVTTTEALKLAAAGNMMELKKGAWSPEEDQKLMAHINSFGIRNWAQMPKAAGLSRSGKSCRLRWVNYLRPDLKRGRFSVDEINIVLQSHELFGNKWSKIASYLPGRTDNEIKNFWHTHMRKFSRIARPHSTKSNKKPKRQKQQDGSDEAIPISRYDAAAYDDDEFYSENNSSSVPASSSMDSIDFPIIESYSPQPISQEVVSTEAAANCDEDHHHHMCFLDSSSSTTPTSSIISSTTSSETHQQFDGWMDDESMFAEPLFSIEDEYMLAEIINNNNNNNSSTTTNWGYVAHHHHHDLMFNPQESTFSLYDTNDHGFV